MRAAWLMLVIAIAIAETGSAAADGLDFDAIGVRTLGRAGVGVVSEDGAAALWLNPGGMVRRSQRRLELGVSLQDADRNFTAAHAPDSPTISDRGTLRAAPSFGVQGSSGRLVFGAGYIERGDVDRVLPRAQLDLPAGDVVRLFPHRYAGTGLSYVRRSLAVGAAVRVAAWLGVGASVGASHTELQERRRIWAGFGSRDMPLGNPTRDLVMELDVRDRFAPEATIGALVAPPQLPLELALSFGYRDAARLDGDAALAPTTSQAFPQPLASNGSARIDQGSTFELRAGLRYLGERVLLEADARMTLRMNEDSHWALADVRVRDDTGIIAELTRAPTLVDRRDHARVGAAADIEVVRGFLWLTAGYAFRSAATRRERTSAIHGDTATHTFAVGAEGHWSRNTLTIGYSRDLSRSLTIGDSAATFVNPFEAGAAVIGNGRYDHARDAFGVRFEVAWE